MAVDTSGTLVLKNQFGEESINTVLAAGTTVLAPPVAGISALAAISTPNAATQTAGYVQADVQTIATLANQLKTQYNLLLAALKAT